MQTRGSEKGSAAVEFALSFALLWAFFAGVFQFGYSMYLYNALASAVSNGARFAARVDFDAPGHNFVDQVKNVVVFGSPAGGTTPLVANLTTAHVNVTWSADARGVPRTITVRLQNYAVNAVFTGFNFYNKPSVTVRYAGSYKT